MYQEFGVVCELYYWRTRLRPFVRNPTTSSGYFAAFLFCNLAHYLDYRPVKIHLWLDLDYNTKFVQRFGTHSTNGINIIQFELLWFHRSLVKRTFGRTLFAGLFSIRYSSSAVLFVQRGHSKSEFRIWRTYIMKNN